MVATQFAPGAARAGGRVRASHRAGRAMAIALVATLTLGLVPPAAATAHEEADAGPNVFLRPGAATLYQDNFHQGDVGTNFVDNSTTPAILRVPVYNTAGAIDNVPVYAFFEEGGFGLCVLVNIPAASGSTPGEKLANFTLPTRLWAEGAHNITLATHVPRPSQVAAQDDCDPESGRLAVAAGSVSPDRCISELSCRIENPTDLKDNYARAYVIKQAFLDLRVTDIRWCIGERDTPECLDTIDGQPANVTPMGELNVASFFEAEIENHGSWHDLSNYGGPCNCSDDGFAYRINVTIKGNSIVVPWFSSPTHTMEFAVDGAEVPTHRARSSLFYLDDLAGLYNATVWADREGSLRRAGGDNSVDSGQKDVEIAYRDYTATFTAGDFRTSAENPYPHVGGGTIRGNVTFKNIGPASTPSGTDVEYRIYLDNLSAQNRRFMVPANAREGNNDPFTALGSVTSADNAQTIEIVWPYSDVTTSDRYLPPGRHTIYAEIDMNGTVVEGNESNNVTALDIYIADATAPVFSGDAKPVISYAVAGGAAVNKLRPAEPFNVHVAVTDQDNALTVIGNFTLASNESVYRTVKANRTPSGLYAFSQFNFTYHNFSARSVPHGHEVWTLRVQANDSFGNMANSSNVTLTLEPWPIHMATPGYVVKSPLWPHATVEYQSGVDPEFRIHVRPNMTGYGGDYSRPEQQTYTQNLAYNITSPRGLTTGDGSHWDFDDDIATNCPPDGPAAGDGRSLPVGGGDSPVCAASDEARNNTFWATVVRQDDTTGPGLWNYSIEVKDISGEVARFNGSLLVRDSPPRIVYSELNLTQVVATANLTTVNVTANVTDDSNETVEMFVNFKRFEPNDSAVLNFSLPVVADPVVVESETVSIQYYNHTLHLEIGRGKAFGLAGKFDVTIAANDSAGNWEHVELGTFEVSDPDAPRILEFGVLPAAAEIGENVTFWATASDATNVTMELEIFRSSTVGELLFSDGPVIINESGTNNYTFTTNFSAEAIHAWRFRAVDGAKLVSDTRSGTLTVRDNLGPKYDIRSPATVIDGTRYASAMPRIEIQVSDVEGVLNSSIDLRVAGQPTNFQVVPASGSVNGFVVLYEVPSTRRFSHLDVIDVNITAQDGSAERLTSFLNFSFVVDAVAPTTRLISVSPSYRDQPGHVLNVSLASRFTFAAEDVDNLPTDVRADGIRYRIVGGGPGAETVYTGPFRINDAPGVYTGPRLYTIHFWAEDAVGNFNPTPNMTTVYVDDTPPALFQFFPQGTSINATFVDDRVGVNRSVVWYRLSDDASYVPLALNEIEGAWSASLPGGVKGNRISYFLQAWDRLDNTERFGNETNPYASFDVSNHEPRLRITSPVTGSKISRSVDLTWEASDDDGDALVYTIYVKAPGRQSFAELTKIENTAIKRFTIDTTRYADGEYTFRLAAGDGGFVKLAETTVTILNRVDAVGIVSVVGNALPGETLLIKAEVTKAEALVEARLYLGEKLVDSWAMNDEGRDGDEKAADRIYSVRVPVEAAGDYRVEIFTRYQEDGEMKESTVSSAATFSAKLTPGYILGHYGAIIALIGLLAAVGIGVAVFVVMRRR